VAHKFVIVTLHLDIFHTFFKFMQTQVYILVVILAYALLLPQQYKLEFIQNMCQIGTVNNDFTGPIKQTFDICPFLFTFQSHDILRQVSMLIQLSHGDQKPVVYAGEYGSRANIIYLQRRKLVMINPQVEFGYNPDQLKDKNTCTGKLHTGQEITIDYPYHYVNMSFYTETFHWSNVALKGREACWMGIIDYFKKL